MSKNNKQPEKKKPIKRKTSEDSTEDQKLEVEDKEKIFKAKKKLKSMENKNLEITNEIEIEKENIIYNTPVTITYKNCEFKINTRKYYELYESTWKCTNYRRKKDLPKELKIFCNATIKGMRDTIFKERYKFFLVENHSELCNNLNKNNIKKNINISEDIKIKKEKKEIKKDKNNSSETNEEENENGSEKGESNNTKVEENIISEEDKLDIKEKLKNCTSISEIDKVILNICKENKTHLSSLKNFQRKFLKYYDKNKIKMKKNHLKYVFNKFKKICFPSTLDEIYDYCNYIEGLGYFCRSVSRESLLDEKKQIIDHSHLIFFTELSIKRLIISENLLIDGTFTYPKGYYQTIIIMFYDPIIFKMIPGIFIAVNNKTKPGYIKIFSFIRDYIYKYVANDLNKITCKYFTTDFEVSLHESFKNVFNKLENLKHKGCFFHYMKNIRKFLIKNGFTKKINMDKYNYIIKKCYNLPFKKNINKNINKEIKTLFGKNIDYEEFERYFKNQWTDYFKNKSLCLEKIAIKFRTTNSLENFNRVFKNEFNKKGEIDIVIYVDTLITITKEQKEYFENELNKQPEKSNLSDGKIKKKDNSEEEMSSDNELKKLMEEFEQSSNEENNSLDISDHSENSDQEISSQNLNNKVGFIWDKNSCAFDSFITIFIYSIYPHISNNLIEINNQKFKEYIIFIDEIIAEYLNKEIKFYEIYEAFNKSNKTDIYTLKKEEVYSYNPIVINYRILVNIPYFYIKYKINHYCTGKCKFSKQPTEILNSTPYIDIPLVAYEDNRATNIEQIFNEYIYINLNTICQEENCVSDDESIVNWYIKKYEVLEMPLFLSINININDYSKLLSFIKFVNQIFLDNISIYKQNYKLIAFVTQPKPNHYVAYFENYYSRFSSSLKKWFHYDDLKGKFKELKNIELSLKNIREYEPVVLLLYLKIVK